jgi:hypothetical protein
MIRCDARNGFLGRCRKEHLHPGDHDNGRRAWPRVGSELHIYQLALDERERYRTRRRRFPDAVRQV